VLAGHDAAICAVGPGGMWLQSTMIDAAEAAKVKRFILGDFGWGKHVRNFPEFDEIKARRTVGWDHAAARAEANPAFTWTAISTGNPIDWVGDRSIARRVMVYGCLRILGIEEVSHHGFRYRTSVCGHIRCWY
jgi:hypothetical protein